MASDTNRLPAFAAEIAEAQKICKHCGKKIIVVTALALLTEDGSYFCDTETMQQAHAMATN